MKIRIQITNKDTNQDIIRDYDTENWVKDTAADALSEMIEMLEEEQTYPEEKAPF